MLCLSYHVMTGRMENLTALRLCSLPVDIVPLIGMQIESTVILFTPPNGVHQN